MKWLLIISIFVCNTVAFTQRPDLNIGVQGTSRLLSNSNEQVSFNAPGMSMHMQVSKRSGVIGVQTGYWTTFNMGQTTNFSPQHNIHLDVLVGVLIIRKPSFKLVFYPAFSNTLSLVSGSKLNDQEVFQRYGLQVIPELSFRYKYLICGTTYTFPINGADVRGPGIKLGINL